MTAEGNVTYVWIGVGAAGPLNFDADVMPMLRHVLGERLEVTLTTEH